MLGSTPSQHIVFYGSIYKDKEFTMFKPDDNNFEQSHFAAVLALTKENLEKYRKEEKALSDELYTLLETYGAKDEIGRASCRERV